jgi:hypothetical protein
MRPRSRFLLPLLLAAHLAAGAALAQEGVPAPTPAQPQPAEPAPVPTGPPPGTPRADDPEAIGAGAVAVRRSPTVVRYGKWALAAGALGMHYLASREHDRAEDVFAQIRARCDAEQAFCGTDLDGTYTNPETEALFQRTLSHDRRARTWLVGGQLSLLGAAGMFIWELTRPSGRPDNIPFEPKVTTQADGTTRMGVRVAF